MLTARISKVRCIFHQCSRFKVLLSQLSYGKGIWTANYLAVQRPATYLRITKCAKPDGLAPDGLVIRLGGSSAARVLWLVSIDVFIQ